MGGAQSSHEPLDRSNSTAFKRHASCRHSKVKLNCLQRCTGIGNSCRLISQFSPIMDYYGTKVYITTTRQFSNPPRRLYSLGHVYRIMFTTFNDWFDYIDTIHIPIFKGKATSAVESPEGRQQWDFQFWSSFRAVSGTVIILSFCEVVPCCRVKTTEIPYLHLGDTLLEFPV